MKRYTQKDFKEDLFYINTNDVLSGVVRFAGFGARNGYSAVDEYVVASNGTIFLQRNIECGTPRECIRAARNFIYQQKTPKSITRQQVKQLCHLYGVDFSKDFYEQDMLVASLLVDLAKLSKYRKPNNANGSLARYFYQHLIKKVDCERHYYTRVITGN